MTSAAHAEVENPKASVIIEVNLAQTVVCSREISQFTITKEKARSSLEACSLPETQKMQETRCSGTAETDLRISVTGPLIACLTFPCVALNKALRSSG